MGKKKQLPHGLMVFDTIPFDHKAFSEAEGDQQPHLTLTIAVVGEWKSREMKVTEKHLDEMLENFNEAGRPLLFDLDHNSIWGESKAAGWGANMRKEDDKLVVDMIPTPMGKTLIENGEYRYLSPVYETTSIDRITGKERKDWRLHSVALTNVPFLHELPPIKNNANQGDEMNELFKALGVDNEEDALKKVNQMNTTIEANSEKIQTLQRQINDAEVEAAVNQGKLLPAQKELAKQLINQNRSQYEMLLNSSPAPTITTEVPVPEAQGDGLDVFKDITSFSQLLNDVELAEQMEREQPKRYHELHRRFMKEGK